MGRWFLALYFLIGPAVAIAAPTQTVNGREYVEKKLLLSESDYAIRLAAKSIRHQDASHRALWDTLAEVAWDACSGNRVLESDTLAWLAKAIGASKQTRYTSVIDYCTSKTTDEKVIKYLAAAKEEIGGSAAADAFKGGKINLAQLRAHLANDIQPLPRNETTARFAALHERQSENDVFAALGRPDDVGGISVPKGTAGGWHFRVRYSQDMMVWTYTGLGEIRFGYDDEANDWLLATVTSKRGLYWSGERGRLVPMEEVIATNDPEELREIARYLVKRDDLTRPVLDSVADRIYRSRLDPSKDVGEALAYLCKVITQSRDGRYKPMMVEISEITPNKKLKKYSIAAADALPDPTGEKFVPSSSDTKGADAK